MGRSAVVPEAGDADEIVEEQGATVLLDDHADAVSRMTGPRDGRMKWRDGERVGFGAALLAAPGRLVRLTGTEGETRTATAARVLGVRHLFQAVAARGSHASSGDGAAIDGVHTTSMIAVGLRAEGHRSVCVANALTAAALVVASLAETRREL